MLVVLATAACRQDGAGRANPATSPSSGSVTTDSRPTSGPVTTGSVTTGSVTTATVASVGTDASAGTCPASAAGPVAESATLTLGPAPGMSPTSAAGQPLIVWGTVYDESCAPLAGASLRVWQTDGEGVYGPGHGSEQIECCYLQGTVRTDPQGRYQLVTVVPGHYKGERPPPPAHIHLEGRHPAGGSIQSEIVFAGDPYLADPSLDGYVVVTLAPGPAAQVGVADLVFGSRP